MKRNRSVLAGLALLVVLPLTFTSCATTHLVRWGFGETSMYREQETEFGNSFLRPGFTTIGLPIAGAWDLATLPFQLIWSVYPWGERHLVPSSTDGSN